MGRKTPRPDSLRRHNEVAEQIGGGGRYRGVIITVPGIRTAGGWQHVVAPYLQDAGYLHCPVEYGYRSIGAMGLGAYRIARLARHRISDKAEVWRDEIKAFGLHMIGHSFGTLAIGTMLRTHPEFCVRRIVLVGSILRCSFPWAECTTNRQVEKVLCEIGGTDMPVGVARWLIWHKDVGTSGRDGFEWTGETVKEAKSQDSGHDDLLSGDHCQKVWLPFLGGK